MNEISNICSEADLLLFFEKHTQRERERERETFKQSLTLMISMVPLVILVGMLRAWKKEVFSGPIPVF